MASDPNAGRSADVWTKRVRNALKHFDGPDGEGATQEDVVGDAYRLLGLEKPSRQQANSYFNGIEPKFRLGVAICVVLRIDPVALAGLGEHAAKTPILKHQVSPDRRETDRDATPDAAAAATGGGGARPRPARGSGGRTRR